MFKRNISICFLGTESLGIEQRYGCIISTTVYLYISRINSNVLCVSLKCEN